MSAGDDRDSYCYQDALYAPPWEHEGQTYGPATMREYQEQWEAYYLAPFWDAEQETPRPCRIPPIRVCPDALPPAQREAWTCVVILGMGHAETCKALGIGRGTLRDRLYNARKALGAPRPRPGRAKRQTR